MKLISVWDDVRISEECIIEIGFGGADYLRKLAEENKNKLVIGIEKSWESVKKAIKKLKDFHNVYVVFADAKTFFRYRIENNTVNKVISLFPEPWPKKKHKKKRLFSVDFFKVIHNKLKQNGEIMIVSDHLPYVEEVYENAISVGLEGGIEEETNIYGTKYEKKWKDQGKKIYKVSLIKIREKFFHIDEELVEMQIYKFKDFVPERLDGIIGEYKVGEDVVVVVKEWLYDEKNQKAMIKIYVSEREILHICWVEIFRDIREDVWVIRISEASKFLPTKSMVKAFDKFIQELNQKGILR